MPLQPKKSRRKREEKDQAIREVQREKTKRLNAEIPEELHRKVKLLALQSDKNITDIVIESLTSYLMFHSKE